MQKIKKINIVCKEQHYNNASYLRQSVIKEMIEKELETIEADKKINIRSFRNAKQFHDRTVTFKIIVENGESEEYIYELTGGIDKLMDQNSETKIYYYRG